MTTDKRVMADFIVDVLKVAKNPLTDGEICEKCGTVLVEQEEIPKLEKEPDNKKEEPENIWFHLR